MFYAGAEYACPQATAGGPLCVCERVNACVYMWMCVCVHGLFKRVIKSDVFLQWSKILRRLSWLKWLFGVQPSADVSGR